MAFVIKSQRADFLASKLWIFVSLFSILKGINCDLCFLSKPKMLYGCTDSDTYVKNTKDVISGIFKHCSEIWSTP